MLYELSDIVALVIVYNPSESVLGNFKTYLNSVSRLYIMDNSDDGIIRKWMEEFCEDKKIIYINNCGNKGISYSLNFIIKNISAKWILTMDQDSSFLDGMATEFIYQAMSHNKFADEKNIYAYSAHNISEYGRATGLWYEDKYAITSGCLLNVNIARNAGGFDEALFIDEVDFEFSWRCKKKGYKLFKYNKSIMMHTIGNVKNNKFINLNFESDFRYEYIFRNVLYEIQKHPDMFLDRCCYLIKIVLKNLLFNNQRFNVLKAVIRGILLFICNSMGKINKG